MKSTTCCTRRKIALARCHSGAARRHPVLCVSFNNIVQLEALLAAAEAFLEQEHAGAKDIPEQLYELLRPGTSMGGARPKNVVEDGAGLWLAKFPDRGDKLEQCPRGRRDVGFGR